MCVTFWLILGPLVGFRIQKSPPSRSALFLRRFAPVVHFFWPCVFASFARFLGGKRKPQVTSKSALIEKNCSRSKQKRNDLEIFGHQSCDRHDHFSGTKRHSLLQSQVSYFV